MGRYAGFKYGTGVLYGSVIDITSVEPESGPSPGGNKFAIYGEGFDPRNWDDAFSDPTLDTFKWTDISVGGGSVSTGSQHLMLSTGAAAGDSAGIESVADWSDTQGEIRVLLSAPITYPTDTVVVVDFCLYVDASNYACMYVTMDVDGNLKLYCETWVGGVKSDEFGSTIDWTFGISTLKLLRWGSDVYFIANGSVIWNTVKFVDTDATFRISSENDTANYDVTSLAVEQFYFRPFAVFQNQPVHDTVVVSNTKVRGTVPPSKDVRLKDGAYEGTVDVAVVGNGVSVLLGGYEYYYVKGLKVINSSQFGVQMSIVGDPQLETPAGEEKGLGGGY